MFLNSMRHGIFSGIFLAILILGGFGLMLSDWGGFFKNGIHRTDVASIDGHAIHAQEFDHVVRQSLKGQNMSTADAYRAGLIDRILKNEIMARLLRKASYNYGIVASDAVVADHIKKVLEPVAGPGGDMKQALARVLQMQGSSERDFVESLRNDLSTSLLRDTIGGGIYVPASMTKSFYEWNLEERSIKYVVVPESSVEIAAPDDKALAAFYDTIKTQFSIPETRNVTIAILDPSLLVEKTTVTDDQIKKYYDEHPKDYAQPLTKSLELATLKTEEEAKNVLKNAQASKDLKAAVTKVTGSASAYSKGDNFQEKSLPEEVSKPVFAAKQGEFVGPLQSPLGWHVILVGATKEPTFIAFDKVKDQIKQDLTKGSSSDALYDVTNKIEDRLAGGEAPSDMAQEFKMKIIKLQNIDSKSTPSELKEFGADQAHIIQAAFTAAENESSPLSDLKNGKMFTAHVDKVIPARAKDLKDVHAEVVAKWMDANKRKKLLVKALDITQQLDDKKTTLDKIAETAKTKIQSGTVVRGSAPPAGITKEGVTQVMSTDPSKSLAIPNDKGITIVTVEKVTLPEKTPTATELTNIEKNLSLDLQEERFVSFVNNVERAGKVKINEPLLEQMYGQQQAE